jgi:predicted ester cyclase
VLHDLSSIDVRIEEKNKEILRELLRATDRSEFDLVRKFYHQDFIEHNPSSVVHGDTGRAGLEKAFTILDKAFPHRKHIVEDMIAEKDKVSARITFVATFDGYLGSIPPTKREYRVSGTAIYRFKDNQIIEKWTHVSIPKELGISIDDFSNPNNDSNQVNATE